MQGDTFPPENLALGLIHAYGGSCEHAPDPDRSEVDQ
jgi:hypothetical protein